MHPEPEESPTPQVVCVGGKWEVDTLAARMLAHALSLENFPAGHRPAGTIDSEHVAGLDLGAAKVVCLSYLSPEPATAARHFCRRIRRRWPEVRIVLGLWNAPAELLGEAACKALGADAVVASIGEAAVSISALLGEQLSGGFMQAVVPEADAQRVAALHTSGALDDRAQPLFDAASQRAADIFDVPMAMVSLIDDDAQTVRGAHGSLRSVGAGETEEVVTHGSALNMPRAMSMCGHVVANAQTLVVPDVAKDLRFAGNPALKAKGLRFYAGAPLKDAAGLVIGTLCLLDTEPRLFTQREVRLMESMARDLMNSLRASAIEWGEVAVPVGTAVIANSATVAQAVPAA